MCSSLHNLFLSTTHRHTHLHPYRLAQCDMKVSGTEMLVVTFKAVQEAIFKVQEVIFKVV